MVVIRLTSGFANSALQFCAGYAIAKTIEDEEIVLDISGMSGSAWGYLLDELQIPDCKKVIYYRSESLKDIRDLYKNRDFCVINKDNYSCLKMVKELVQDSQSVLIDGSFFDQYSYYREYWDELRSMLTARGERDRLLHFSDLIRGKISVGVHIRRTDMLCQDYAIDITDNYYRGAIEFFREKFNGDDLIFCVFSDDISYAQNLLGFARDIRYIHFLGYDGADLDEFLCLSMCTHRILNNNSTYSWLADMINGGIKRITLIQGEMNLRKDKENQTYIGKIRGFLSIYKHVLDREEYKRRKYKRAINRSYIGFGAYRIDKYSKQFKIVNRTSSRIPELMFMEVANKTDASRFLSLIDEFETDYELLDDVTELRIRYAKFKSLYIMEDYESAITVADTIWGSYIYDNQFRREYSDALNNQGFIDEAAVLEHTYNRSLVFVVIPGHSSSYSYGLRGMGEMASCLSKMGYESYIFATPANGEEKNMIIGNSKLTNRHNVNCGCTQFLYNEEEVYKELAAIQKKMELTQRMIIISRAPALYKMRNSASEYKGLESVTFVYHDIDDETDMETMYTKELTQDDINIMKSEADYVLCSLSSSYFGDKPAIRYDAKNYQTPYWETSERWTNSMSHRISIRTMRICNALVDYFK